jgi:hypothetical protein
MAEAHQPQDTERVLVHIDIDAFYAQVRYSNGQSRQLLSLA